VTSSAHILNDVAEMVIQLLVTDEIPDLDFTTVIVWWVMETGHSHYAGGGPGGLFLPEARFQPGCPGVGLSE